MSDITETDPVPITNPSPRKRFGKRARIIAAAAAVLVIAAAAFAVPAIANQVELDNATTDLTVSEKAIDDAVGNVVDAQTDLYEAGVGAATVYVDAAGFIKVARTNLVSDAKTVESLKLANEELKTVSALTVDKKGAATAPEQQAAPTVAKDPVPTSVDAIRAQIAKNEKTVASLNTQADEVEDRADAISEKSASISELTTAVVASGAKFGADVKAFPKADAALLKTLATKVSELTGKTGTPTERFTAYAAAFDAVAKSQADKVAAEKAEADRKAKEQAEAEQSNQESDYTGGGDDDYYYGGDDSGSGSGSDNSNTGDGGSQPQQPKPQPQPQPQPEPQPEPEPEPEPEQPADPGPRGDVIRGGGTCVAGGGSGWASWGSSIYIPADAADYTVWENPGVEWGVDWVCVTEW